MSPSHPRCSKCGYILVGASTRCPECGHERVHRERWVEGELHLLGPTVVQPIFTRCLVAALALTVAFLLGLALNPGLLAQLDLRVSWDARWTMIPLALAVPVACLLWTRPIEAPDSTLLQLDASSAWRRWLPVMQLPWLAYAACVVSAIMAIPPNPPPGTVVTMPATTGPADNLMTAAHVIGVLSQLPWLLTLRHVGRMGEYLRDMTITRAATTGLWLWSGMIAMLPIIIAFRGRYMKGATIRDLLQDLLVISNVGLVLGVILAWLLVWAMAHCLTNAHELVARDHRRAQRERDRFHTPS